LVAGKSRRAPEMYFHGHSHKGLLVAHNNVWPANLRPAYNNIGADIPQHKFKIVGMFVSLPDPIILENLK